MWEAKRPPKFDAFYVAAIQCFPRIPGEPQVNNTSPLNTFSGVQIPDVAISVVSIAACASLAVFGTTSGHDGELCHLERAA